MIYFDHNATTPLDLRVREAMLPFFSQLFANPSSIHQAGRQTRVALDEAREKVAAIWRCKPSEIVFTSGGTESINLALCGVARSLRHKGRHLVTSAVEHSAVLHCCRRLAEREGFELTVLPVDSSGRVSPESLAAALRPDTILVSIMAANNQVGTIQSVAEFGAMCRERGILFHTDAVQWFGKLPVADIHQFNADLVSACSHKFYGPKGAGALFTRSGVPLDPLFQGGGQENEHRAGTENLAAIIGFAEATALFVQEPVFPGDRLQDLRDQLATALPATPGIHVYGLSAPRLSNTLAFSLDGVDSIALVAALDLAGIGVSGGSACSSGSLQPSHVLLAMGLGHAEASGLVRLSLGRDSTQAEVDYFLESFTRIAQRLRSIPKKKIKLDALQPSDSPWAACPAPPKG